MALKHEKVKADIRGDDPLLEQAKETSRLRNALNKCLSNIVASEGAVDTAERKIFDKVLLSVGVEDCSDEAHSFIMYGGVFIDKSDNNMPCWAKNNEEFEHMCGDNNYYFESNLARIRDVTGEREHLNVLCDEIAEIDWKLQQGFSEPDPSEPDDTFSL